MKISVKVINKGTWPLPAYQTPLSAGLDVYANIDKAIEIAPMDRVLVPTGLHIELPPQTEAQIRPRSGLALKKGITVLNSPGTVDADYRGEIKVLLVNLSGQPQTIDPGERIAQMVVAQHISIDWVPSDSLSDSQRGAGGYGSTGKS